MAYAKVKPGDIVRTGSVGCEYLALVVSIESNGFNAINFEDSMINNWIINIRHLPRKPKRRKFFLKMIDFWFRHPEPVTPNMWYPIHYVNMVVERGAVEVKKC